MPCTGYLVTRAIVSLALLIFLSGGCLPPQADFEIGLGTTRIAGIVNITARERTQGDPLIVVFKYHHQFITAGDGTAILRPTAHVVQVGRAGGYSIDMPADVVWMDILFIAPERLTEKFHFRRQLGIGNVTYRPNLVPMPDWRSHFYTFISPQLEHLIVEARYRLSPPEQRVLSQWLLAQNARLEDNRGKAGAHF